MYFVSFMLADGSLNCHRLFCQHKKKRQPTRSCLHKLKILYNTKTLLNYHLVNQRFGVCYHRNEIDSLAETAQIKCH